MKKQILALLALGMLSGSITPILRAEEIGLKEALKRIARFEAAFFLAAGSAIATGTGAFLTVETLLNGNPRHALASVGLTALGSLGLWTSSKIARSVPEFNEKWPALVQITKNSAAALSGMAAPIITGIGLVQLKNALQQGNRQVILTASGVTALGPLAFLASLAGLSELFKATSWKDKLKEKCGLLLIFNSIFPTSAGLAAILHFIEEGNSKAAFISTGIATAGILGLVTGFKLLASSDFLNKKCNKRRCRHAC